MEKKNIDLFQLKFLKKIKKNFSKTNNSSSCLSSFNYLSNSDELSEYYLKFLYNKKKIFIFIFIYLKNLIGLIRFGNYEVIKSKKINNVNRAIISWGSKNRFSNNGIYYDGFFNINSKKNTNILWIIIYNDKVLPRVIPNNFIIFKRKSCSFKNFFKNFFLILKEINFKFWYLHLVLSFHSFYAIIFYNKIFPLINNLNLKKIIIPYEGQPVQKFFTKKIIEIKKKIKIYGYVHTFPQAIPLNYIYSKKICPHKIVVNGESQKKCFSKHLDWHKNNIIVRKSLRFFKKTNNNLKNKILIPYKIQNEKKILKLFEIFLKNTKKKSLPNLLVKNHPQKKNSYKHQKLKKNLLVLLKKYKSKFGSKKNTNFSIFLESTSSIIEGLERNINVFQLCTNAYLQAYSPLLWEGLKRYEISEGLFNYKISKKNELIKLSNSINENKI